MKIKIRKSTIVGGVLSAPGALHIIKVALDWIGRYDAGRSIPERLAGDFPWYYGALAIALAIIGTGFIFWGLLRNTEEYSVTITPFVAAAGFTACALVAWGFYFYDLSRGPIIWSWDGDDRNWIGWSGSGGNPTVTFNAFQIAGWNRSDDPITVTEAFVRSDITSDRVALLPAIERISGPMRAWTAPVKVIPAGKRFLMQGALSPNSDPGGVTSSAFKRDFGRLTLMFNGEIVRRFYEFDIEKYIRRIDDERRKAGDY